jgi:TRAP-type C4-dicarboxylate transport system permease small subunit
MGRVRDGGPHDAGSGIGETVERFTRWLAYVGGGLLLVAAIVTLVSVVGRYSFSRPLPGDYEIVEIVCAIGVFLFFPYAHATSSNITAKFFTSGLSERSKRLLDLAQEVVFSAVAVLLTWRLGSGLADKFGSGETSILIGIPLWWAHSFAVLSMALLTIVCLSRIVIGIRALRR